MGGRWNITLIRISEGDPGGTGGGPVCEGVGQSLEDPGGRKLGVRHVEDLGSY